MKNQFSPDNKIIQICMTGMAMEAEGKNKDALGQYQQAWNEATNDFERFIAAYFVARLQNDIPEKIKWLKISINYVTELNDDNINSALRSIYSTIAQCYEKIGDIENAKTYFERSETHNTPPSDQGPFYHGTKADLKAGDLLTPGRESNYQPELKINHIYFTALIHGAGLAAGLAKGPGRERIYIVEPTGEFENDPNVTDKKFPGNLTRSYRSRAPLRIIGEITDWTKKTPEELNRWHKRLADNKGEIIN